MPKQRADGLAGKALCPSGRDMRRSENPWFSFVAYDCFKSVQETRGPRMQQTYSRAHQLLHWATFALFLVQIWTYPAIGRTHHAPEHGIPIDPFDLLLHNIHAISGGAILLFALLRLWLRFRHPVEPAAFPHPVFATISKVVHVAIYGLLVLLPITGFLKMYIVSAAGTVHVLLTRALYGLLVLHLMGVLVHVLLWRDGLLTRMGIRLPMMR